jgi:hypothetical protein
VLIGPIEVTHHRAASDFNVALSDGENCNVPCEAATSAARFQQACMMPETL